VLKITDDATVSTRETCGIMYLMEETVYQIQDVFVELSESIRDAESGADGEDAEQGKGGGGAGSAGDGGGGGGR
jgi:uncharacterized membrane protein